LVTKPSNLVSNVDKEIKKERKEAEMPTNPTVPETGEASTSPKTKRKKKGLFLWAEILRWVLFGLIVLISLISSLSSGKAVDLIVALVTIIISAAVLWVLVPILVRRMADQGLFFLRVPEMRAALILCDKVIHKILISASEKHRTRFDGLVTEKGVEGVKLQVLESGQGLVWMGVPWKYQRYEWYEKSDEEKNPEIDPQTLLVLSERIFDFTPPDVDTAEPIEIHAKLTVYFYIYDPYKALFGVRYYLEALALEIASRWRKVISLLHYFQYIRAEEGKSDLKGKTVGQVSALIMESMEVDPEIIKLAHRRLLTDLWLAAMKKKLYFDSEGNLQENKREEEAVPWDITDPLVLDGKTGKNSEFDVYDDFTAMPGNRVYVKDNGEVKESVDGTTVNLKPLKPQPGEQNPVVDLVHKVVYTYTQTSEGKKEVKRVFYKLGIPPSKAVRRIFEDWGVVLKDVEVTDIEPKEIAIREALSERLKARAAAMAVKETAAGHKAKDILEGEGVKQRTILEGEGQREARRLALVGDAEGFTAQIKALGLSQGKEASIVLIAEQMRRITEKTQMTVMAGSGAGWTDLFGSIPLIKDLWSGKPQTSESFIGTLSSMSEADLAKVKSELARIDSSVEKEKQKTDKTE